MKIAVLANLKEDAPSSPDEPPGRWDDLDDQVTVDAILSSLKLYGYKARYFPAGYNLISDLQRYAPDICFNFAEGHRGDSREAQVPAILDMLSIPYTGSGVLPMMLSHNKHIAKNLFRIAMLPTPDYFVIQNPSSIPEFQIPYPLFVKPANEGSSIGINENAVVHNQSQLQKQVEWVYDMAHSPILVEKYIVGREFTIGILGSEILPIVEVVSPTGYYSNELKESVESGVYRICPAHLPYRKEEYINSIVRKAVEVLGLSDLCRMDMRMDEEGNPYILEINPLPLLHPDPEQSSFVYACRSAGIDYPEMINRILTSAFKRIGLEISTMRVPHPSVIH